MRRRGQVTVAGLAGVGVLLGAMVAAGLSGTAGPPGRDRGPDSAGTATAATPTPPVVLADCWVPADDGNVSLATELAQRLTTVAATAGRRELTAAVGSALEDTSAGQAAAVTASLRGDPGTERLTCSPSRLSVEPERMGASGLTPRAQRLRRRWTEVFGPLPAGGFAPGGVSTGHVDSSSHYDGRAVDVFFRPHTDPEQRRRGRLFAQWLVAHAQDLNILSVIYADQIWTSWAASLGWREYVHPSGDTTNAVLRHLDHVHVAVESGRPYRPR